MRNLKMPAVRSRSDALRVPSVTKPAVSIVIVTQEGAGVLERTLQALLEHTEPCYELILVDNASTDGTRSILRRVENAKAVFNERNEGFGVGSNQGAAEGTASNLLFLNQDVFVHAGWLPPLLERLDSDERIGAVGPMLLNPDGSLQCAGAIVLRSGSTVSYGEGDDPERAQYGFPRVVDYLAGACLLMRRRAFDEAGGFDPVYGLAYFEDADLGLALSARGYRSLYEPGSQVTHVRGTPSEALLQLALRNRTIFEHRWRDELALRPVSPPSISPMTTVAASNAPT